MEWKTLKSFVRTHSAATGHRIAGTYAEGQEGPNHQWSREYSDIRPFDWKSQTFASTVEALERLPKSHKVPETTELPQQPITHE